MNAFQRFLRRLPPWTLTTLVVAAICWLTLVPRPLPDEAMVDIPGIDKVVHAVMFGAVVMALAVDRVRKGGQLTHGSLVAFLAIGIAFGGVIELAQNWMHAGRTGDLLDFIADCTGALIAYVWAPRFTRALLG